MYLRSEHWVNCSAESLPENALRLGGGRDGKCIYVVVCSDDYGYFKEGDELAEMHVPVDVQDEDDDGDDYDFEDPWDISDNNGESFPARQTKEFEILTLPPCNLHCWVPHYAVAPNNLLCAFQCCEDEEGEPLYLARVYRSQELCFALVTQSGTGRYLSRRSGWYDAKDYEMLVTVEEGTLPEELYGWTEWDVAGLQKDLVVSAGNHDKCSVYVIRYINEAGEATAGGLSFYTDPVRGNIVILTDGAAGWIEVLIAKPGTYHWCHKYGRKLLPRMFTSEADRYGCAADDDGAASKNAAPWPPAGYGIGLDGQRDLTDRIGRVCDAKNGGFRVGTFTTYWTCTLDNQENSSEADHLVFLRKGRRRLCTWHPQKHVGWAPLVPGMTMDFAIMSSSALSTGPPCFILRECNNSRGHNIRLLLHPSANSKSLEVLLGNEDFYKWVSDGKGYVPNGAVWGGETSEGEPIYVGRVTSQGQVQPGKVVGSRKGCIYFIDSKEHLSTTYEVLTIDMKTVVARMIPGYDETHASIEQSQSSPKLTFVEALQELQRDHMIWLIKDNLSDQNPPAPSLDRVLAEANPEEILKSEDWIPYCSRFARRSRRLPSGLFPILCKFIETAKPKRLNAKCRAAAILNYGIATYGEEALGIVPLITYLASSSESQAVLVPILEALPKLVQKTNERLRFLRRQPFAFLHDSVRRCMNLVTASERARIMMIYHSSGIILSSSTQPSGALPGGSGIRSLEWKLKAKSLRTAHAFQSLSPVAHTVDVQQTLSLLQESTVETALETGADFWVLFENCRGFHPSSHAETASNQEPSTLVRKIVQGKTTETVKVAARDLRTIQASSTSGRLTNVDLALLLRSQLSKLDDAVGQDILWAIIFSLSKLGSGSIDTQIDDQTVVRLLAVTMEPWMTDQITVEAICAALYAASDCCELTGQVLKSVENMLEAVRGNPAAVKYLLLLLCDSLNERESVTHEDSLVQSVYRLLADNRTDTSLQILATKYLYLVTSKQNKGLNIEALRHFVKVAQEDPTGAVRLYARAASANALWNDRQSYAADAEVMSYISVIFVTRPVELVVSSPLPEDFTYKINGPLLRFLKFVKTLPNTQAQKLATFLIKAAETKKPGVKKTFRKILSLLLEFLSCVSVLPGAIKAVEHRFLTDEEDEKACENYLEFITTCLQKGLVDQGHEGSRSFLESLASCMLHRSAPIYVKCLHMYSNIQELPAQIFYTYDLEMSALRLTDAAIRTDDFFKSQSLNRGSDDELIYFINAHVSSGESVSRRAVEILLKKLLKTRQLDSQYHQDNNDASIFSVFRNLAVLGFYFKQAELDRLFSVELERSGSHGYLVQILRNQGLPRETIEKVMDHAHRNPDKCSLQIVEAVVENYENPKEIIPLVLPVVSTSVELDSSIAYKAKAILHKLIRSRALTVTDLRVVSNSLFAFKSVRPSSSSPPSDEISSQFRNEYEGASEEDYCGNFNVDSYFDVQYWSKDVPDAKIKLSLTEILLDIVTVFEPNSLCWEDVEPFVEEVQLESLLNQSDKLLSQLFTQLEKIPTKTSQGKSRPMLNVMGMLLEEDSDKVVSHTLEYIQGSPSSDTICAAVAFRFTTKLESILCHNYLDCERVLDVIKNLPEASSIKHLEPIGDAVLMAWSTTLVTEIRQGCESILQLLYRIGWKPSAVVEANFRSLMHLLKKKPGVLCVIIREITRDRTETKDGKVNDSELEPISVKNFEVLKSKELLTRFIPQAKDIQEQAVSLIYATDICRLLQMHKAQDLLRPIVESPAKETLTDHRKTTHLKHLHAYLSYLGPSVTSLKEDKLHYHASIFQLGKMVHSKFRPPYNSWHFQRSLILGMELHTACRGQVYVAELLLQLLTHVKYPAELERLIQVLDDFPEYFQLPVFEGPMSVDELIINFTVEQLTFKLPSDGYAEVIAQIKADARYLLSSGVCSVKHLVKPVMTVHLKPHWEFAEERVVKNLAKFLQMVRKYGVDHLSLDFVRENNEALEETSRYQRTFLRPMLTKHFTQGIKPPRVFLREFVECNDARADTWGTTEDLMRIVESLRGNYKQSSVLNSTPTDIPVWSEKEIHEWGSTLLNDNKLQSSPIEFLSVARRALEIFNGWRLTVVQIVSVYNAITAKTNAHDGLVQEVRTGAGKSTVISLVAIFKALQGQSVDIHTTSSILAQRDAEEWSAFYNFFSLGCTHNGETQDLEYLGGTKKCYEHDKDGKAIFPVIYGEIRQFQFDCLRDEYSGLNTRGQRPYQCVIVDEMDSIYIDDASKLTVQGQHIPGMDLLQPIYHHVWSALRTLDEQTNVLNVGTAYFTFSGDFHGNVYHFNDEQITLEEIGRTVATNDSKRLNTIGLHDRKSQIKSHLTLYIGAVLGNKVDLTPLPTALQSPLRIHLPTNLLEITTSQRENWVEGALTAATLHEGKEYVISDGKVFPLDPNNGATQLQSNWSNGLQQFLQIKHSLSFSSETLMTAFMSNRAMLRKYAQGSLIGFSGTVGVFDFFRKENMQILRLPALHYDLFRMFPPVSTSTKSEWFETVTTALREEISNDRAVLLICKDISTAYAFQKHLEATLDRPQIKLFVRSHAIESGISHRTRALRANPNDVFITTLLGTRGMDIKTHAIEPYGGLHVILTYVTHNARIQTQAFGRTARQGNLGSAQIIARIPKGTVNDIESLLRQRDDMEQSNLQQLLSMTFPLQEAKDAAFESYREMYNVISTSLRRNPQEAGRAMKLKGKLVSSGFKAYDLTILECYQEYWASHYLKCCNNFGDNSQSEVGRQAADGTFADKLKVLRTDLTSFKKAVDKEESSNSFMTKIFKQKKKPEQSTPNESPPLDFRNPKEIFNLTRSCFYPTRYGLQFYRDHKEIPLMEKADKARSYIETAVEFGEEFATGAYAALAYLKLMGDKRFYLFPRHDADYKVDAQENLGKAFETLELETAQFNSMVHVGEGATLSEYQRQLRTSLDVRNKYAAFLLETLDLVNSTLRPVYSTRFHDNAQTTVRIPSLGDNLLEPIASNDYYKLECHGLGWKKDLRPYHQAADAIKLLGKASKLHHVTLTIAEEHKDKLATIFETEGPKESFGLRDGKFPLGFQFTIKGWNNVRQSCSTGPLRLTCTITHYTSDQLTQLCQLVKPKRVKIRSIVSMQNRSVESNAEDPAPLRSSNISDWPTWETTEVDPQSMTALPEGAEVILEEPQQLDALVTNLPARTTVDVKWVHADGEQGLASFLVLMRTASKIYMKTSVKDALKVLSKLQSHGITPQSIIFTKLSHDLASKLLKKLHREQDPIVQQIVKPLSKAYAKDSSPSQALFHMKQRGLHLIAKFRELGSIRARSEAILLALCVTEFVAGVTLLATGIGTPFGVPLLTAAAGDLWQIISAHFCRDFSWKTFLIAKPLGLLVGLGLPAWDLLLGSANTIAVSQSVIQIIRDMNVGELFKKLGPLMWTLAVLALSGPIFTALHGTVRESLVDKVTKTLLSLLEQEKWRSLKHLLRCYRALDKLESARIGNDQSNFEYQLELRMRLWLESSTRNETWIAIQERLRLTLSSIALKNWVLLTFVMILESVVKHVQDHVEVTDVTEDVCRRIEASLKEFVDRHNVGFVLERYCNLSEEQVDSLGIPAGSSPFDSSSWEHLLNSQDLVVVSQEELQLATDTLNKLRDLPPFDPAEFSTLLKALAGFITDRIIGASVVAAGADLVTSKTGSGNAEFTPSPSLGQGSQAIDRPSSPLIIPIPAQHTETKNTLPATASLSQNSDLKVNGDHGETIASELMKLCEDDEMWKAFPNPLQSTVSCLAAKHLADAVLWSNATFMQVKLIEKTKMYDDPEDCSSPIPTILYKLDPGRAVIKNVKVVHCVTDDSGTKTVRTVSFYENFALHQALQYLSTGSSLNFRQLVNKTRELRNCNKMAADRLQYLMYCILYRNQSVKAHNVCGFCNFYF